MSNTQWTKEETTYLTDNYGDISYVTLAKNLNRSVAAVKAKREKLKLGYFLDNGDYITFFQLIKAFGYDKNHYGERRRVWVDVRGLPTKTKRVHKNSFLVVDLDEFWKWAEKNKDILDFSRLEENLLGAEPSWVRKKRAADFRMKRNYKATMQAWTPAQEKELLRLVSMHKYSYAEISKKLGRTDGAIQHRLIDLGIKDRPLRVGAHDNPWKDEERDILIDMIKKGYSYELMSEELNRSAKAIRGFVYRAYGTENLSKVFEQLKK